ncbi:hypothetical protein AS026_29545 [Rhizobium altiplani]|uniref:Uncharacterized protein n=1 Tax=Rhizobium altiplani TaxID=1864509 RepID=A0A125Q9Y3_9HYPH|nr:hypothetical protein AS026_29545 [Rhizobium altiplani]
MVLADFANLPHALRLQAMWGTDALHCTHRGAGEGTSPRGDGWVDATGHSERPNIIGKCFEIKDV